MPSPPASVFVVLRNMRFLSKGEGTCATTFAEEVRAEREGVLMRWLPGTSEKRDYTPRTASEKCDP